MIIPRGVAFDRITFAAAVIMPTGITICSGLAVGAFFAVIALPFVVLGLRNVLRQPPLLRGDARGLWFGRGRIVPWPEVSLIYESATGARGAERIGLEFHRRSTWLRLPIEKQFVSVLAFGQLAVTTPYATGVSRTLLIAQLHAVRTRAVSTEDGVTVSAVAIPSARLVDRSLGTPCRSGRLEVLFMAYSPRAVRPVLDGVALRSGTALVLLDSARRHRCRRIVATPSCVIASARATEVVGGLHCDRSRRVRSW